MENKTKWLPEGELDTPYKRARQEWDNRMGTAVVSAKNWRLATFGSLGLVGLSIIGLIYLGSKPKLVPHIVQVDAIGAPTYVGPIGNDDKPYAPSDAVLKYHLRRFLEDTRTVSLDTDVLKRNWLDAYNLVTSRGANMLTAYVSRPENDPFKRAVDERITVEVASMVRITSDTWQIDWRETKWDSAGVARRRSIWRGMFRVVVEPPRTEEVMSRNPIGLYVDEFHWDEVHP